ncbi:MULTISPECIES: hypothetical protein [Trichocoleus]|uniref:Uncharacterized protein n=1 Tax=Trichocoleus desertorum GB2-A4 TaxID=2933944 RepID=A0ABV0JG14_9CYAN|nr:hypothetical protein [Trichocoleus sp. FACHB-46]MBD1865169.1 hypothetical protein [Trichocoleus sp. FACHB-46]
MTSDNHQQLSHPPFISTAIAHISLNFSNLQWYTLAVLFRQAFIVAEL